VRANNPISNAPISNLEFPLFQSTWNLPFGKLKALSLSKGNMELGTGLIIRLIQNPLQKKVLISTKLLCLVESLVGGDDDFIGGFDLARGK